MDCGLLEGTVIFLHIYLLIFFKYRLLLYSPSWPTVHYVAKASLHAQGSASCVPPHPAVI